MWGEVAFFGVSFLCWLAFDLSVTAIISSLLKSHPSTKAVDPKILATCLVIWVHAVTTTARAAGFLYIQGWGWDGSREMNPCWEPEPGHWLFDASSIFRFSIGFGIWEAMDAWRESWLMIGHAMIMTTAMTCVLYAGYMQQMMVT